jgi:hypothetical protein
VRREKASWRWYFDSIVVKDAVFCKCSKRRNRRNINKYGMSGMLATEQNRTKPKKNGDGNGEKQERRPVVEIAVVVEEEGVIAVV